jgi:predicted HAD superfamily Cof-like phosphohydrolase
MRRLLDDVWSFHYAAGEMDTMPSQPTIPSAELLQHRLERIEEEFIELKNELVHSTFNIENVAGEMADLIYVIVGSAQKFGIPLERVWNAVHKSNMDKVRNGVARRADGKIIKPEGWQKPDMRKAVYGEAA